MIESTETTEVVEATEGDAPPEEAPEETPNVHEATCKKCKTVVASGPDKKSVDAALKRHNKQKHGIFGKKS